MNASLEIFSRLGAHLADFGCDARSREVIRQAVATNEWFSEKSILLSISAIRSQFLDEAKLAAWLAKYPYDFGVRRGKLGIVMAGNIPAVGFFDLLCGVICGYECHVKSSSKDSILIDYLIDLLGVGVFNGLPSDGLDTLLASGSDATMAQIGAQYRGVKMLLRGSRSSVAVLSREWRREIKGLRQDIFSHNGLGCRNVSHLFLPRGFDAAQLVDVFSDAREMVGMWRANYLQVRALHLLSGEDFIDGGFFLLREDERFSGALGEITYQFYDDLEQVRRWLAEHDAELQCVVASEPLEGAVAFGQAQFPRLEEYPDRADVIEFLCNPACHA